MATDLTHEPSLGDVTESVMIKGDLAPLSTEQRVSYYKAVCDSLGLNWLTKPFDYLSLNGKLTLYAKKDCADQLRKLHEISVTIAGRESIDGVFVVTARATTPQGRTDESIGAVNANGLKGDALANAMMKAETKAKRRVTLSICGLGWTDESEIDGIPGARVAPEHTDGQHDNDQPTPPKPKRNGNRVAPDGGTIPPEGRQEPEDPRIAATRAEWEKIMADNPEFAIADVNEKALGEIRALETPGMRMAAFNVLEAAMAKRNYVFDRDEKQFRLSVPPADNDDLPM